MIWWYIVCMLLAAPVAWYWDQISPDLDFWYFYPKFAKWISIVSGVLLILEECAKYM